MKKTILDIVYILYNNYNKCLCSIEGLVKLFKNSNINFTVHIHDNSFTINKQELINKFINDIKSLSSPLIQINYYPSDKNIGFGSGCNNAVNKGSHETIAIVNCDTSFLKTDVNTFKTVASLCNYKNPIIGPKILTIEGLIHSSCFSFDPISIALKPLRHARYIGSFSKYIPEYKSIKTRIDRITYEGLSKNEPSYVDWVSGCFMFVNRKFFRIFY